MVPFEQGEFGVGEGDEETITRVFAGGESLNAL